MKRWKKIQSCRNIFPILFSKKNIFRMLLMLMMLISWLFIHLMFILVVVVMKLLLQTLMKIKMHMRNYSCRSIMKRIFMNAKIHFFFMINLYMMSTQMKKGILLHQLPLTWGVLIRSMITMDLIFRKEVKVMTLRWYQLQQLKMKRKYVINH